MYDEDRGASTDDHAVQRQERMEAIVKLGAAVYDTSMLRELGDIVLRQATQNRLTVKGVSNFAQSVSFLSEKMAKGPTSESGIKKLELGLTTQIAPAAGNEQQQQQSAAPAAPASSSSSTAAPAAASAPQSVSSTMGDSLVKAAETLSGISSMLEQIEAQTARIVAARKRREMQQSMLQRLRDIAAKKNVVIGQQQPQQPARSAAPIGQPQVSAMMLHQ